MTRPESLRIPKVPATALDIGITVIALLDVVLATRPSLRFGYVISIVAALVLLARRRFPLTVLIFTLPGLFGGYAALAPIAALYTVAERTRNRSVVLFFAAPLVVAGFLYPWPPLGLSANDSHDTTLSVVYALLIAGAPTAIGLLTRARAELSNRIVETLAGRDREQSLLTQGILAHERAQLAREMHDVVSHQVSLIAVQAGALRVTAPDARTRDVADTIRQLSVKTLEELRHMVDVLRAAGGRARELAPQPRLADIPRLVESSGADARLVMDDADRTAWPEPVQRAAYRTVQEALTNVNKHAPGACVSIRVEPCDHGLLVEVVNGAVGWSAATAATGLPGGGHGLIGLRERAALLGGALDAGPAADGGYRLRATFPRS